MIDANLIYAIEEGFLKSVKPLLLKKEKDLGKNLFSVNYLKQNGSFFNASKVLENNYEAKGLDLNSAGGSKSSNLGVLNIKGPLSYSYDWIQEFFGGTSYEQISKAFDFLVNDPTVGTILIKIQSPGGVVFGVSELAKKNS